MSANIDQLAPTRSLIDLSRYSDNDFGLHDFNLCRLFDDLILAEYIDQSDDGETIMRDGVLVPTNAVTRAWRIGRVILAGSGCKNVSVGDEIMFPHDKGLPVKSIEVDGHGELKYGVFLNEERLFGVVKRKE